MRYLDGVYTRRFNQKHQLDGALFRGRYKSQLIDTDEYLRILIAYIHLNPVRAGIEKSPSNPNRTSHPAYAEKAPMPDWLTTDYVLAKFSSSKDVLDQYVLETLAAEAPPEVHKYWDKTRSKAILGTDNFVAQILRERNISLTPHDFFTTSLARWHCEGRGL